MKTNFYSLLLLVLFFTTSCIAQNKWEYLPNIGLDKKLQRFEDVFFINNQRGHAVNGSGGIFKTQDGGSNWHRFPTDTSINLGFLRSIEFLDNGKTGIVGTLSGKAYRTDDSGNTWIDISSSIADSVGTYSPKAMCGLAHYGDNFFGVGWYGSDVAHFYKSTDRGLTWTTIYIDTSLATGLVDVVFWDANNGYASGTKGDNKLGASCVVLKTTDGGNTWTSVFADNTLGGFVWKLQFIDKLNAVGSIEVARGTSFPTMVKSTDGGNNWNVVSTGLLGPANQTQGVGFANPLKGWLGGKYGWLYQTLDGGATWDTLMFGGDFNRFFVIDSAHIYAAGKEIYRFGSDFSVGIRNHNYNEDVPHKIYPITPNPSNGKVKIEFDLGTNTYVALQVFPSTGNGFWSIFRGVLSPGHYTYYWDEPNAPNGTYIVQMNNNEIPISEKFILSR